MLTGEKVTLRAFTREDVPLVWKFRTDVEVELAGGGDPPRPLTLPQVEGEFEKNEFIFKDGFAIEAGGRLIGFCGLFHQDNLAHTCELGITIGDKEQWGKGCGRDAVRLLLDYALRMLNLRRVWLHCISTNERAIRCYRSCGFVEEGRLREQCWCNGRYTDQVYMGILRSEWESAPQGG
jgi:RimJ/RimL family protein N-acetyltransferase